jgi:hypothetical protein
MVQIAHLDWGQSRLVRLHLSLGLSLGSTVHAAFRAILLRITLIDVSLWVLANIIARRYNHSGPPNRQPIRKSGTLAMDPVVDKRHGVLALITDSLRKLFGMNNRGFASQRMCPFCGLITSRRKTCCLECGKTLKPA